MRVGDHSTNPHAYLARFGGLTGGKDRPWVRWALSHPESLMDLQKRQPHISEFIDQGSLDLAKRLGVRVAHHGKRI